MTYDAYGRLTTRATSRPRTQRRTPNRSGAARPSPKRRRPR
jgi:hypothetical protein